MLLLLPLLSCIRESREVEPLQEDGAPDGRVSITFSCSLPETSLPSTKALGESSELHSMYLAVFGSSGYYKEYVPAELVSSAKVKRTFYDESGAPYTRKVDTYVFKASIKLSNTPRTIHFLGNGPQSIKIGNAKDVLPSLLGEQETGFWQMIKLDEIKAKTDADGNYLNPQGEIRQPGEDYMVDPETQAKFELLRDENGHPILDENDNVQGGIALIRNWAKIVINNNYKDNVPDYELDPSGTVYGSSNFTPISFAVVHVPKHGTLVPYDSEYDSDTGFVENYQTRSFRDFFGENATYPYRGNLPAGADFDHTYPSIEAFTNPDGNPDPRVAKYNRSYDKDDSNKQDQGGTYDPDLNPDDEPAVYLYERPAPSSTAEPSFVIIYGLYKNPKDPGLTPTEKENGVYCFYKIDLMDNGTYYPIYRNFKYRIQIRKITSRGYNSPEDAAASAGSADVSADITASTLPDISDGKRRMAIQYWMAYTFIEGDPDKEYTYKNSNNQVVSVPGPAHVFVKFYDDITAETPRVNTDPTSVHVEVTPQGGGVIENDEVVVGPPDTSQEAGSNYGWRPVYFKVKNPGQVPLTQTIRLSCKTDWGPTGEDTPLYRDIVVSLLPKQNMVVTCQTPRVLRDVGEEQVVDIRIPDGLVESMFPLVFTVEPQRMTLTSDSSKGNLPVVSGKSINPNIDSEHVTVPRFAFKRTLTWDEYCGIRSKVYYEEGESRWKTFSCYFKTNCEYSGTEIWVANEFFNPVSTRFADYRSFKNAGYTTAIPVHHNREINVHFEVKKENGEFEPVLIELKNLKWPDDRAKVSGKNYYSYTPEQELNDIILKTTTDDGNVSVTLFTESGSYEAVTLTPYRFSNVGFIDTHVMPSKPDNDWGSNVVFGMINMADKKNVLFGYSVDPRKPKPVVKINNAVNINTTTSIDLSKSAQHNSPYAGDDNFYWIEMTSVGTSDLTQDASFTLSAEGYVEQEVSSKGRFSGYILSYPITSGTLRSWFGQSSSTPSPGIKMKDTKYNVYFSIYFTPAPKVNDQGLELEMGKTYLMEVQIYKLKNSVPVYDEGELVSIQFTYYRHDGVPQKVLIGDPVPDEAHPNHDEGVYYQYMGNEAEYIWSIPRWDDHGTNVERKATIKLQAPNTRSATIESLRIWGFKAE